MSGFLLSTYIDEDECDESKAQMMWLIIGLATITSPILITIFDPCLREPTHKHSSSSADEDGKLERKSDGESDDEH